MKQRFKLNEKVIIKNEKTFQVGIIINKSIQKQRRTFDIKTETGYIIPFVPVDEFESKVYIDSEKSKKFSSQIKTNLNSESSGNYR